MIIGFSISTNYFHAVKILSASQIRALDKFTIEKQKIASIDLMERAADAYKGSFCGGADYPIVVFCGQGNNGGDGLAIARMMLDIPEKVSAYIVEHDGTPSKDFLINKKRLEKRIPVKSIKTIKDIPKISPKTCVIDAIFGSGLSRPADGIAAAVIQAINKSKALVYSVDVPSGLFCDHSNAPDDSIVQAIETLTFHAPKFSFFFPENARYIPSFEVIDIELDRKFATQLPSNRFIFDKTIYKPVLKKRPKFSHKGDYGHALVAAGSFGKIGAAVLSVKAALRSGAGLITAAVPACGYEIMQSTNPEAMALVSGDSHLFNVPELSSFDVIAVGPGLGVSSSSTAFLFDLLNEYKKPLVLDADALNIISAHRKYAALIPVGSILTPHPGEFKRLVGEWKNDEEKYEKQVAFSVNHKVVIVLKGTYTSITNPEGEIHFMQAGNPGMAKGGSGDVLTGILVSLLAQKYTSFEAALLGVYVHGQAGDLAKKSLGETTMKAGDIIEQLPAVFKDLEKENNY